MRKIMEHLLALQKLQFDDGPKTPAVQAEIEKHRAEVPAPILGHYERLVVRGKKGVAMARHGVCGECHLQITSSKLVGLITLNDVILCDNCGRYLFLPEGEAVGSNHATPVPPAPAPVKRRAKKAAQAVA
jgi:hypothetical protein